MTPHETILAGRPILDAVLAPAGFQFDAPTADQASGGPFATASYHRDDRRLTFSYRYALGAVEYSIGNATLEHITYMRLLGVYERCELARFSRDEPLAGFQALRHDLEAFADDFLRGPGDEFRRLAAHLQSLPGGQLPGRLP